MRKKLPILMITLVFLAIIFLGTHIFLNTQLNLWQPKELTEKQKIEDFEYMYDILKDNYAHFYEVKKMYGYDWLEHKEEFKEKIRKTKDNLGFYYTLTNILLKLHDGHTYVLSPGHYKYFLGIFGDGVYKDMFRKSEGHYKMWEEIFKKVYKKGEVEDPFLQTRKRENIETDIIKPEKITYLKVYSFLIDRHKGEEEYKKEKEKIYDFLKGIKDYPYLVIDVSDNGGGSTKYWLEAIVAPLRNKLKEVENLSVKKTYLIRGGGYVVKLLSNRIPDLRNNTIDKLPVYDLLPEEIKKSFAYYVTENAVKNYEEFFENIEPIDFKGKIFLVVSSSTYSGASIFAEFCKETGFATVIGERTRKGDGGWLTTSLLRLPNSGLIVRFDGEMLINQDGTSYFETGTIPDIEIKMMPKNPFEKDEELKQKIRQLIKSLENEEKGIK
ncbi:MAG: S41 family peptidase [Caldanaerobacter sp.]